MNTTFLESLTIAELKELKKRVTYAIKMKGTSGVAECSNQTDLSLLYHFFYLKLNGLPELMEHYFKNIQYADKSAFEQMCVDINNLLAELIEKPNKAIKLKFYNLSVSLILMNLSCINIPVSLLSVLRTQQWMYLAGIIDQQFPGYMNSGMFLKVLENFRKE